MDYFFIDSTVNFKVTWDQLVKEVTESTSYNPYCYNKDYYEVFKQLVISLLYDEEIILLDSDFSEEELLKLTGISEFSKNEKILNVFNRFNISNKKDLIHQLQGPKTNWSISLYTSGTTGLPKKVTHKFETIARFVKKSDKNAKNIWGFAYNPTHMAGIQVFLQAVLNGNSIIRLFNLPQNKVYSEIENYCITNISATPTFYRLLLPHNNIYPTVNHITSGGEKFDERTINHLTHIFPNASITNVYASTEAGALFASTGNNFYIKPEYHNLIKIDDNELLIHMSLVGETETKFDSWYRTGDIIEIISENPITFRFLSRKNEMINVGGYKVNPSEVEDSIRNIQGINDVRVYAKKNSVLGNIICCEIVRTDNKLKETDIRAYLQTKLQEYKIPRMIIFVDEIATTRTGKIKRR